MALSRNKRNRPGFVEKVLGRLGRLDTQGLQTVVQRLARERNLLETLFNTIEDGILVTDEKGRIVYLNQAVTRLLGLTPENAEGEIIARRIPQVDWDRLSEMDNAGGPGGLRQDFEVTYPEPRLIRLYAAPLDGEAPGSTGLALILHDATAARREQSEAVETERGHALTLLAASLAHEIGNPLNALHIHLQLMERELRKLRRIGGEESAEVSNSADRLGDYVGVAKGEIARLDYIITEFLQALRPSPPKKQFVSLNTVVEETLMLLGPELENRGLLVESTLPESLPQVQLDAGQMKQVLVNLLKNAMQATNRGGSITIATGATPDAVWLSVADTGSGIPPELLNQIFQPFYTTKKKGTGLGLMIVQRIVRDHDGRIELESKLGKGTTFRIWLPRHGPRLLPLASEAVQ